jgi:hypothetical protein
MHVRAAQSQSRIACTAGDAGAKVHFASQTSLFNEIDPIEKSSRLAATFFGLESVRPLHSAILVCYAH